MKRILRTSPFLPAIRSWQHFPPHTATGVNCRFVWLPDHDMTVGRWDWLFCFSLSVSIWMKPGCLTMTVWTLIFPMVCFSDCLIPYPVSLSNDEMRRWPGDFWPRCKYIKHHLAVFILVSKKWIMCIWTSMKVWFRCLISLSNPEISIGTMADSGTMMWLDEEQRSKFAVVLRWWFSSRMTSKYLTADLEIVIMIELLQWYLTNQVRSGTKQH